MTEKLAYMIPSEQHQAHQSGLNDAEFLAQIVQPLEDKIYADRSMVKELRNQKKETP